MAGKLPKVVHSLGIAAEIYIDPGDPPVPGPYENCIPPPLKSALVKATGFCVFAPSVVKNQNDILIGTF